MIINNAWLSLDKKPNKVENHNFIPVMVMLLNGPGLCIGWSGDSIMIPVYKKPFSLTANNAD